MTNPQSRTSNTLNTIRLDAQPLVQRRLRNQKQEISALNADFQRDQGLSDPLTKRISDAVEGRSKQKASLETEPSSVLDISGEAISPSEVGSLTLDANSPTYAQASASVLSDLPARAPESITSSLQGLGLPILGVVGLGLALGGGGGGGGGSGQSQPSGRAGVVQDGLVKGATVFIDVNGNGDLDDGEPSTTTNEKGGFTINSDKTGPLVAKGGINTDTGLDNLLVFKAQAGSTVVNPISTLIQSMVVDKGMTAAAAETAVKSALGLPSGLNLATYDPIAAGDTKYQKAVAQLVTVAEAVAKDDAAGGGATVFAALAGALKASSAAIDLGNNQTLTSVFNGVPVVVAQATDLAAKNTAVASATSLSGIAQKQLDSQLTGLSLGLQVNSGVATDDVTNNDQLALINAAGTRVSVPNLQFSIDGGKTWADGLQNFKAVAGANAVTVRVKDPDGEGVGLIAPKTNELSFTFDNVKPGQPAIALKIDSGTGVGAATDRITNAAASESAFTVTPSAGAEAGSRIEFSLNGGAWATTFAPTEGANALRVRAVDVAGNISDASPSFEFTLDTRVTVPVVGIAAGVVAGVENDTGLDLADGVTRNASPVLASSAEAGATIVIGIAGKTLTTIADTTGQWAVNLPAGTVLPDSTPDVSVTITDVAGNVRSASGKAGFTIDTQAPPLASGGLSADLVNDTGLFDNDGITGNTRPSLSGFAEAGARVEVDLGVGDPYVVIANDAGRWSFDVRVGDELEGEIIPLVTVTDRAGNVIQGEGETFFVDTVLPDEPTAGLMTEEEFLALVESDEVFAEQAGVSAGNDTFMDRDADSAADFSGQDSDGITSNTKPVLVGTAGRDAEFDIADRVFVQIRSQEVLDTTSEAAQALKALNVALRKLGTIEPDAEGHWVLALARTGVDLLDGTYVPEITAVKELSGAKVVVDGTPFVIKTVASVDSLLGDLVHDEENDTGLSIEDGITKNATPTLTGTAEPGSIVTVFFDNESVFTLEEPVGEDGQWSLAVDLPEGIWTPQIFFTDAAGNVSETIDGTTFTIDTVGSAEDPTGGLLHDDVNDTGSSVEDNLTNNAKPVLRGTAEPLSFVRITIGESEYETISTSDGTWEVRITEALPDGEYTPSVYVYDAAGNEAGPVDFEAPFTIDTQVGSEGTTTTGGLTPDDEANDTGISVSDGITQNRLPALSGTTEPSTDVAEVLVRVQLLKRVVGNAGSVDTEIGEEIQTVADSDGTWSVSVADMLPEVPEGLADGTYIPRITVSDAAGNLADPVLGQLIVIDNSAPGFTPQTDLAFIVGERVTFRPTLLAGVSVLEATDETGNLVGMGLELDPLTGQITGTVIDAADANSSWVNLQLRDAAGNVSTDSFQIATADTRTAKAGIGTINNTTADAENGPTAVLYVDTAAATSPKTVSIQLSVGDVIDLGPGNDTASLSKSSFDDMRFAQLNGGAGDGDTLSLFISGTEIDLGDFNRSDAGSGQVLVNFEVIQCSLGAGKLGTVTVTPEDLVLLGSDRIDQASASDTAWQTLVILGDANDLLVLPTIDESSEDQVEQDFIQVGAVGAWGITGEVAAAGSTATFTKLRAVVADSNGDHAVELLVASSMTIQAEFELIRAHPVIG